jgi:hypothetical protein
MYFGAHCHTSIVEAVTCATISRQENQRHVKLGRNLTDGVFEHYRKNDGTVQKYSIIGTYDYVLVRTCAACVQILAVASMHMKE